jgi:hypothetical protein
MRKLLGLLFFLPLTVFAHEDHGNQLTSMLSHIFSSPEHVWPLTLGLAVVAFILFKKRS